MSTTCLVGAIQGNEIVWKCMKCGATEPDNLPFDSRQHVHTDDFERWVKQARWERWHPLTRWYIERWRETDRLYTSVWSRVIMHFGLDVLPAIAIMLAVALISIMVGSILGAILWTN